MTHQLVFSFRPTFSSKLSLYHTVCLFLNLSQTFSFEPTLSDTFGRKAANQSRIHQCGMPRCEETKNITKRITVDWWFTSDPPVIRQESTPTIQRSTNNPPAIHSRSHRPFRNLTSSAVRLVARLTGMPTLASFGGFSGVLSKVSLQRLSFRGIPRGLPLVTFLQRRSAAFSGLQQPSAADSSSHQTDSSLWTHTHPAPDRSAGPDDVPVSGASNYQRLAGERS